MPAIEPGQRHLFRLIIDGGIYLQPGQQRTGTELLQQRIEVTTGTAEMPVAAVSHGDQRITPPFHVGGPVSQGGGQWLQIGRNIALPRGSRDDQQESTRIQICQLSVLEHLATVPRLLQLRRQRPALRRGDIQTLYAGPHSYVFARTLQSDQVVVACNRHPSEPRTISLPLWQTASPASRFTDAFNGEKFEVVQGEVQLTIPANSARVLLSS